MLRTRKPLIVAVPFALLVVSCGGEPTATVPPPPSTGVLDVIVDTSGGDLDDDGYGVVVDGTLHLMPGFQHPNADSGSFRSAIDIPQLPAGTHTVTLDRIAGNCAVNGSNPRQFVVVSGQWTVVNIAVRCLPTGIEVTARTTGFDNPPTYELLLDGRSAAAVGSNGSKAMTRLAPGSHVVTIGPRAENCDVPGGRQATVTVVAATLARVTFDVTCAHAVRRERIAFAMDTIVGGVTGRWIGLVNPDGSGMSMLVQGYQLTWSPDGTRLAYSNTTCDYYGYSCEGGIMIVDPEHWTSSVLPDATNGLAPAWSPVGETVAFTRCCASADRRQIFLSSSDGRTPPSSFQVATDVGELAWSPDGLHLLFTCLSASGRNFDLCSVDRDSANFKYIGVAPVTSERPAWSPDGLRIAFTRLAGSSTTREVVVMDVKTRVVTALMDGDSPAWAHDGTRLVMSGSDGLYVIDADGTHRTRILKGEKFAPAWRP